MKTLYLYTTLACHLCEQAEAITAPCLDELGYRLKKVEISESEQLMERYGIRIPVLQRSDNDQELGWPFDQQELLLFLQS